MRSTGTRFTRLDVEDDTQRPQTTWKQKLAWAAGGVAVGSVISSAATAAIFHVITQSPSAPPSSVDTNPQEPGATSTTDESSAIPEAEPSTSVQASTLEPYSSTNGQPSILYSSTGEQVSSSEVSWETTEVVSTTHLSSPEADTPLPPHVPPRTPSETINNFNWDYKTPYEGAGQLSFNNNEDTSVHVNHLRFTTNAQVDTESFFGDLVVWGKTSIELISNSGNDFTYEISTPEGFTFEANTSKSITLTMQAPQGPFPIVSLPSSISASRGNETVAVDIAGKCVGKTCDDPIPHGKHNGGYYTNWDMYSEKYPATEIPVKKLNHIYVAFMGYHTDGSIHSLDTYSDSQQLPTLTKLSQQYPYLKIIPSYGGYTLSSEFPALAADPQARTTFATNVVAHLKQFQFHGADIDWEYPENADTFIALLRSLRTAMDESGEHYTLSIASTASVARINAFGEKWGEISDLVDHVNVMNYDYNGGWESKSNYHSPLELPPNDPVNPQLSTKATLAALQDNGVPADKIAMGLPAYYRGVNVAGSADQCYLQDITGVPNGQFDTSGMFDYACAVYGECREGQSLPRDAQFIPMENAPVHEYAYSATICAPDSKQFYSGESVSSVRVKTCYAKQQNYKGVFFWALAGDVRNDENKSLLHSTYSTLQDDASCEPMRRKRAVVVEVNEDNVDSEQAWQQQRNQVWTSLTASFAGGVGFGYAFGIINAVTEKATQIVIDKIFQDTAGIKPSQLTPTLTTAVKNIVYFTTLYYIGMPLLPAAIGKVIAELYRQTTNTDNTSVHEQALAAEVSGTAASLSQSLASLELNLSPQAITLIAANVVLGFAGSSLGSLGARATLNPNVALETAKGWTRSIAKGIGIYPDAQRAVNDVAVQGSGKVLQV